MGRVKKPGDPLALLDGFESLTVGPLRLETDRFTTPYTVVRGASSESVDLQFKFTERVFEPDDPLSVNLASMMAAQVAMNYGLFCKTMRFRGLYDRHDRRFIEEMTRHTAREIYVNKFLKPNPFLVDEVGGLPGGKREFLRARIVFEGHEDAGDPASGVLPWKGSHKCHAVLSSGGKDSLLSYGLLDEIGRETHPVFVNESGRHWFTALNAFRHFEANVPRTARAWTNSDRVFSWMLRHLPFVRQDFARVRSDDYPIRLWTVAVYIFAALPLLRKRGVSRLIIGDEIDTTERLSYKGITHYRGLYDQSRYFDDMMSRYFAKKRWGISQFSLLRPMSEMLIEKTLMERYPQLQVHQTSCHATHVQDDRVRPCGKCEKCRRIVGILTALSVDPQRCGYTDAQIESALQALGTLSVHQEKPGTEHVLHLLVERGLIPASSPRATNARAHPEIMKLRFEPRRSPTDMFPSDLRKPIYRILLEHAQGALRKSGKLWLDFDPLEPDSLSAPYRFEPAARRWKRRGETDSRGDRVQLGDLTWPEATIRFRDVDVALLPVGATEQHGPHLPLDVDSYDVAWLSREVASSCAAPRPIVLPLIPYGVSYHHDDFAGTVSLSPETLSRLVHDVGMSVARHGVNKLVIINGHGGNTPALQYAAQMINRDARIFTCVDTGETSDAEVEAMTETSGDVHAGEIETSTTLALRPEVVRLDLAQPSVVRFSSEYLDFSSSKGVAWFARTMRLSPSGVLGNPTKASPEKGRKMWDVIVRNLVRLVEDLKEMSLDEIHERRY